MSQRRSFSPKDDPAMEAGGSAPPLAAFGSEEDRRVEAFGGALLALIRSELDGGPHQLPAEDCTPFLVRAAEVIGGAARAVPKPRRLALAASLVDALLSSAEIQPAASRPAEDVH